MNPNNCATCAYKDYPQGGHCYMFRNEPSTVCAKHLTRDMMDMWKDIIARADEESK